MRSFLRTNCTSIWVLLSSRHDVFYFVNRLNCVFVEVFNKSKYGYLFLYKFFHSIIVCLIPLPLIWANYGKVYWENVIILCKMTFDMRIESSSMYFEVGLTIWKELNNIPALFLKWSFYGWKSMFIFQVATLC